MDTNPVTLELYKRGSDAVEKFDYFICGVTGAIFSYGVEHYSPQRISFSFSSLEPLSLILLALSFYFGMQRLAKASLAATLNHRQEDARDKAEQCSRILADPNSARDIGGSLIDVAQMQALHNAFLNTWEQLKQPISVAVAHAKRHYKWRDRFLIAGFVAILASKVLQPYGMAAVQTAPPTNMQTPTMRPSAIQPNMLPSRTETPPPSMPVNPPPSIKPQELPTPPQQEKAKP